MWVIRTFFFAPDRSVHVNLDLRNSYLLLNLLWQEGLLCKRALALHCRHTIYFTQYFTIDTKCLGTWRLRGQHYSQSVALVAIFVCSLSCQVAWYMYIYLFARPRLSKKKNVKELCFWDVVEVFQQSILNCHPNSYTRWMSKTLFCWSRAIMAGKEERGFWWLISIQVGEKVFASPRRSLFKEMRPHSSSIGQWRYSIDIQLGLESK